MRAPCHFLAPFALALALYAVTIPGTYVYDDVLVAKEDPRLHGPHLWGSYWREGYYQEGLDNIWRPIVSMTIAVQAWAHPNHAWPFHLVNVLLHAGASGMVGLLGARLGGRRVGLIAGLLFAAHPVHVEAVAGIVGRAESMATIGILAALLLFIDRPLTPRRALAITACFLFAALCKEQGILIPAMLLAYVIIFRREQPASPDAKRNALLLTAFITVTLAAYISYRNSILPWYWERGFLDQAINPLIKSTGADRWLIPLAILGRYVALLFFPYRLFIDYSAGVFTSRVHWHEPYVYVGFVCIALGAALLIIAWRRRWRAVAFCIVCFALVYFLVSNVILIGTVFGERLAYVPSAFFCILIAIPLARLTTGALATGMTILLAFASVRTVTYAWRWNDPMRLFEYAYRTEPRAANINLLLAKECETRGDVGRADEILKHARQVAPQSWLVWYHSAKIALKLDRPAEAMEEAHTAMRIHPSGVTAGLFSETADALNAATSKPATRPSN